MTAPALAGAPRGESFYDREADDVARDLLGDVVVSTLEDTLVAGRIVECEAYLGPHDAASHAAARTGRTRRNAAMFGPPGTAYVYRIYGLHSCLNAVTGPRDFPAAVLIRALEPVAGIDVLRRRRGGIRDRDLARGPGRLTEALAVAGALDGHRLEEMPLQILSGNAISERLLGRGPRVGVTRAVERPLRFWIRGCNWVSR